MTKPHPNAHILQRLAELAQTTDKPWEHFECQNDYGDWLPTANMVALIYCIHNPGRVRERILNPITINGATMEGPMTEAPEHGTDYWLLFDNYPQTAHQWDGMPIESVWMVESRCFRTKEARDAVQVAITKLLKGEAE